MIYQIACIRFYNIITIVFAICCSFIKKTSIKKMIAINIFKSKSTKLMKNLLLLFSHYGFTLKLWIIQICYTLNWNIYDEEWFILFSWKNHSNTHIKNTVFISMFCWITVTYSLVI